MENIFEDYQNDVFYKLENNVFKNKFNEIELNDLNLIKNAHKISSNDSPLGFFLHKVFQKN